MGSRPLSLITASPMESMNTIWGAESEFVGHHNKAKDLEHQAANHRTAGNISMASSIIGGVGSAAGSLKGFGLGG